MGQHFGDIARELARRGHRVVVVTAAAGYHDPTVQYPLHERTPEGVEIRRTRLSSLGKSSLLRRIVASLAFMGQVLVLGLRTPQLGIVVFSTSPPFIGVIGAIIGRLRRVRVVYWVMDLNPDQLIALGKISASSVLARALARVNRFILGRSSQVVALDPIMADRLEEIHGHQETIHVIPPWSPDFTLAPIARAANPFRAAHGLTTDTVIMYSGNHTPSNPLNTLLEAAVRLRNEPRLRFVFVGDGAGKSEVERYLLEYSLSNILSLPYQPHADLAASLSAADVHVVSLGDGMAGIIHPSKVYGAMAVGRPILFIGPAPSHVDELLAQYDIGWHVAHGDVEATVATLRNIADQTTAERDEMGARARLAIEGDLSPERLCGRFCDLVEQEFGVGPS